MPLDYSKFDAIGDSSSVSSLCSDFTIESVANQKKNDSSFCENNGEYIQNVQIKTFLVYYEKKKKVESKNKKNPIEMRENKIRDLISNVEATANFDNILSISEFQSPILCEDFRDKLEITKTSKLEFFSEKQTGNHQTDHIPDWCRNFFKRRGYLIDRVIGHGTYGKVYHAFFENSNNVQKKQNQYAIKIIDMESLSPAYYQQLFLCHEILAMSSIKPHPNIVQTYDFFKITSIESVSEFNDPVSIENVKSQKISQKKTHLLVFIMEFCPNGDMQQYLMQRQILPETYACHWFRQLISAVGHIHRNGFAHRDLKLENMLLDAQFNIKLVDFGFCVKLSDASICYKCHSNRIEGQKHFVEESLTTRCGSLIYASPNLFFGAPYKATLNDVWSCGVILYVMLYGAYPVTAEQLETIADSIQDAILCPKIDFPENSNSPQITKQCRDVFDHIFVNEQERYSIDQLHELEWIRDWQNYSVEINFDDVGQETLTEHFLNLNLIRQETLSFEFETSSTSEF